MIFFISFTSFFFWNKKNDSKVQHKDIQSAIFKSLTRAINSFLWGHKKIDKKGRNASKCMGIDLIIQQNTKKKTINNLQCHKKNKKNIQVLQHAADPLALPLRCRVHATQSGLHAQTTFAT